LLTLYTAIYKDEDGGYHSDERINTKITLLNFDVTMTHSLPLSYFTKFIKGEQTQNEVYLNFFMLMEIYKVKINELWKKAKVLKKKAIDKGEEFDIITCVDHDY
jgi:hypothetical protein